MISNEALADRKWGRYPGLRRLFAKYPVPDGVYGWSSVSDNTSAWIGRLIEIVATIRANMKELEEIPQQPSEEAALLHELRTLRGELRHASDILTNLGDELNGALETLHKAAAAKEMETFMRKREADNEARRNRV
jgi:hypothetical protein